MYKKTTGASKTQTKEKSGATVAGSEKIANRTNNIEIVVASKYWKKFKLL